MQENAIEWLSTQKVVTVTLGNGRIKTQVEKLAESRQAAIDALDEICDRGRETHEGRTDRC